MQRRMSRGRMLRERDEFMSRLGPPAVGSAPSPPAEVWENEYRPRWDNEFAEVLIPTGDQQRDRMLDHANRAYPNYNPYDYDPDWPEYSGNYGGIDYYEEEQESEAREWQNWWGK